MSVPPDNLQVIELLAAALHAQFNSIAVLAGSGDTVDAARLREWQESRDLRREYRDRAGVLIGRLEAQGVKLVVGRGATVERAARELTIVPARVAYELAADAAA